jgi:hypothetical protein
MREHKTIPLHSILTSENTHYVRKNNYFYFSTKNVFTKNQSLDFFRTVITVNIAYSLLIPSF